MQKLFFVVHSGIGTRPKAGGPLEFNSFFFCSGFRVQLIAIYCIRRGVWTEHLTRHFL